MPFVRIMKVAMTSVITGDIIRSKKFKNPEIWLNILKDAFNKLGIEKKYWEIFRGDSFQLEIEHNQNAFHIAVYIKACIKTVPGLDVRMAIGVGKKTFEGNSITESNGQVFQFSGETLEQLKKEKITLKIKTNNWAINNELNLYFKLVLIAIENWTTNSSEAIKIAFENPQALQSEIAEIIGISQDAVSKRLKRAHFNEIMDLNNMYHKKIASLSN